MDKIEKIRQEIERRIKLCNAAPICSVRAEVNKQLLSLLDTLAEEPDKSLEEEIERYLPQIPEEPNNEELRVFARHFAQWQKQQMLKDAVEGEVYLYHSYNRDATAILVDIPKDSLGDKVRIVVLKEEDE